VLVTGFGPFEKRRFNPSRVVAAALERQPPRGVRVVSRELPVSFRGAPLEVERFVAKHARRRPVLILGLGVQRAEYFRIEKRARGRYTTERTDNDGVAGAQVGASLGPTLRTELDVRALAEALREAGADDVRISNDAGGYVCERTYYALLYAGLEHGIPAVFLHVPPAASVPSRVQTRLVRALLAAVFANPDRSAAARPARSAKTARRLGSRRRTRARRAP
jgi:pyrrolidone-carboxylate peptidase